MKPYYHDERAGISLFHGDAREVLPTLAAGSVDLVLTDPPYNVGVDYGAGTDDKRPREDFIEWARQWFTECRRVAATVLMTTGQLRLADYAAIEPWRWLLCWHKPAAMGRSPVGFCNWEPVALWGRGGGDGCDFVRAQIIPDDRLSDHPCPKPVGWATGLLGLFPWARSVADPFAGSGTVLVAAKMMGLRAVGIELEERFCEQAARRVDRTRRGHTPPLFVAPPTPPPLTLELVA